MKRFFAFIAVVCMLSVAIPGFAQGNVEPVPVSTGAVESVAVDTASVVADSVPETPLMEAAQDVAPTEESVMEKLVSFCLEHLNYWTVTAFMAIESSFIPFPSEAVVPPAAWKAATTGDMNIILVVVFATLGAIIGALFNYYLALTLGRPIIYRFAKSRFGHMCLIDEEKVMHAEKYFEKHGAVSTFFGRLVPAVRQLISIPAGLVRMKLGKFLLFTTLGAGAWNIVLVALGYSMKYVPGMDSEAAVMAAVKEHSSTIGYVFIALALFVVAFVVYKGLKKSK
jgi:membrane protein DedA with SNARE-associated domain